MPYPAYMYSGNQQQMPMGTPMVNPMANYFTPQMQQQIQQMQQVQQPVINGKLVENIDSVKLTDVPMDGGSYYFPKADGTEIYTKRWLANGSTEVAVYKRVMDNEQEVTEPKFNFNEMENNIMDKLNSIEEHFSKFEKGFASKSTASKKEATS